MGYPVNDALDSCLAYLIKLFPDILDLNLTASIAIIIVLCVRQFLKGAPKIFSYALWGIVLLRLLVPISIESLVSVVPERTGFPGAVDVNEALPEITFETAEDRINNEWQQENVAPGEPMVLTSTSIDPQAYLTMIWLAGMVFLFVRSLLSYLGLRERVKVSVPFRKGIYIADDIDTPFVMGFFRPVIYLPGTLDPVERKYIIAHERHHIRRGDHVFKALAFLALIIHWFNPLVWVAFVQAGRDMEMSCDEAVIRKLGDGVRAEYSASLLNLATGHRMFAGTPLAFGEGNPTGRVRNLANWKKPAIWVILICLVVCIVLFVCLLTNPETKLPFMGEYHKVTNAELIDLRGNESVTRTYSNAERDELGYRLRDLKKIEEYSEENSIIPIYTLKIEIENLGIVSVDCISWNEDSALIYFNGTTYWIRDSEFIDYLRSACNHEFSTPASEDKGSNVVTDWGVSLKPERVSRIGATALFVYSGNVPGEEGAKLTYGDFLSLDRLVDGNWVPCDELAEYDYFVGDSSYPIVDGYGMVHEWLDRFGELTDGHYRLGKQVTLVRQDGSSESRMVYGEFMLPDSVRTGPIPLEELPEFYSSEQAMIDGCLVSRDGEAMDNIEAFREFVAACDRGEGRFFRLVDWYYGDNPHYIAWDLNYDGYKYTISWLEDGRRRSTDFAYLKHFTGEKEQENVAYDAYEHYVLVNDSDVTWQEIWEGMYSSQYGAAIDHMTIFSDYFYYPKAPDLPDKPDYAILEFYEDDLVTVQDRDRLEKLIWLFENGEYLGYEPKTHSIGVELNLIFASAEGDFVIELDPDADLCRINGEYVWYGKPDEPDYILKLWEYLDITQWPDIVYTVCENALRP